MQLFLSDHKNATVFKCTQECNSDCSVFAVTYISNFVFAVTQKKLRFKTVASMVKNTLPISFRVSVLVFDQ